MNTAFPENPRLAELLSDRAVSDLSSEESQELDALLNSIPEAQEIGDNLELELAAAAIDLTFYGETQEEEMPSGLAAQVSKRLMDEVSKRETAVGPGSQTGSLNPVRSSSEGPIPGTHSSSPSSDNVTQFPARANRVSWVALSGWIAAAAILAFSVVPGLLRPSEKSGDQDVVSGDGSQKNPPIEKQFSDLADSPGVIKTEWSTKVEGFEEVTGEVVWDQESQRGFMRFVNMPVNNPTEKQYQLWIVDGKRIAAENHQQPVDGGVFDVAKRGEVIVPIEAKLKVFKPAAFAITVEKPGGVVVHSSEEGPLSLIASVN